MKSLWDHFDAKQCKSDLLQLRVYTSRLLGKDPDLVLHGGGNTSVKLRIKDFFGKAEDVLFVKGSGWDLATIKPEGFAPVKMEALLRMAECPRLSDRQMVDLQRAAMTDPHAPNPSVEAILHAIIPYRFVDHTHADAVVALTNTTQGEKRVRQLFGKRILVVPYVMPGFVLARKVYEMTREIDWRNYDGMILMSHGVITFHDDAKESYERMIRLVTKAERYIQKNVKKSRIKAHRPAEDLLGLATIRKYVSDARRTAVFAKWDYDPKKMMFSSLKNVGSVSVRGPLTPDHVIRTKRIPVVIGKSIETDISRFVQGYHDYFRRHASKDLTCLDPSPRWAVWKNSGTISFGPTMKEAGIISDIISHTVNAIIAAEGLGGWRALTEEKIFEVEYWDLEQAKLKKGSFQKPFTGKVVLVTGAASGIGRACVEAFVSAGAAVAALDIDPKIRGCFKSDQVEPIICDVTNPVNIKNAVEQTVRSFGGLDIVVSNAGSFPVTTNIQNIEAKFWERSLKMNLTSHQMLMSASIPFLKLGFHPSIVVVGSKNVPAPGPGAGAYSAAKAGLTQLARVAALELASYGIRVNVVHPNQVFDTGIWTKEVLEKRAKSYGLSVNEYKTNNLLRTEITSHDVAKLICSLASDVFSKTTGAQIPIDGGNERVI